MPYPSGFTPPSPPGGMSTLFFDDFLTTTLDESIWSPYSGTPGGTSGKWDPSHIVLLGDSICNLEMYYDPVKGVSGSNFWVGGGMGSWNAPTIPVGSQVWCAIRGDAYTPFYMIALLIGASNWPPEIDFLEADASASSFTATVHYGPGNSFTQHSSPTLDLTAWHVYGAVWTTSGIDVYIDGTIFGTWSPNPDTDPSDVNSLVQDQILSLQIQGDPTYPAADPSITASNPIREQIDWAIVFVPGGSPDFTVSFDANGGSGSMADQSDNTSAALDLNSFTRASYTFAGWNTAPDGSGTFYSDGDTYAFGANVTLYAQWTPGPPTFTVTFDANAGTGSMPPQVGSAPTALHANAFSRAAFVFSSWNTIPDGSGTTYANGGTYAFSADVTMYAQWVAASGGSTGEHDLQRVSEIYPAPTLDVDRHPVGWQPTSVTRGVWGRWQIEIGGIDVTFFRNSFTLLGKMTFNEPFGDEQVDINFPQITAWDVPGEGDLTWLVDGAVVNIFHVLGDDTVDYSSPMFEGRYCTEEVTLSQRTQGVGQGGAQGTETPAHFFTAHCLGAIYVADLLIKTPGFANKVANNPATGILQAAPEDIGKLIGDALNARVTAGTAQLAMTDIPVTGIQVSDLGSGTQLINGYIQDLLAQGAVAPLPAPGTLIVDFTARPDDGGYWMMSDDPTIGIDARVLGGNGILPFGERTYYGGSRVGINDPNPIVAMVATPSGLGYWIVSNDGTVYNFGDAGDFGSLTSSPVSFIVDMERTADGLGYWLLEADGNVHAFGSATNYGNAGAVAVAIARSTGGAGYVILRNNGQINYYGDATVLGNVSSPNAFVDIATFPGPGDGYVAVTSKGHIIPLGAAPHLGGPPNLPGTAVIVAIEMTSNGGGTWVCAHTGAIYRTGNALFKGSVPSGVGQWNSWTLVKAPFRKPSIQLKDRWTVHATMRIGQPGLQLSTLLRDSTTSRNAIYGEGTDTLGHSWRNSKYPHNRATTPPLFPGTVFTIGYMNAAVLTWSQAMKDAGWAITPGSTYTISMSAVTRAFQITNGLKVDGLVTPQVWAATFITDVRSNNLAGAYLAPLAEFPTVEPYLYDAYGGIIGANPQFVSTSLRVEGWETFGSGVDKGTADLSAKSELQRDGIAGYIGTITLYADPNEMSRYDLRAGMNILLQGFRGRDVFLHIAQVEIDWSTAGRPVTLTVDEHAQDLVTVAAMRTADRSTTDPVRRTRHNRRASRITNDKTSQFDFEAGGGIIPKFVMSANTWNVVPIAAAAAGTIVEIDATVTDSACKFSLAVFQQQVTAAQILTQLPDGPLFDPGTGGSAWDNFDPTLGLVIAWGQVNAACGYSPLTELTTGAAITGVFTDQGTWDFRSLIPPWLWVACWAEEACTISGRIFPQPVQF